MPRLRLWCGWFLLTASPFGFAATEPKPAPVAVKAPEQPSAALLEFIGDWNEEERLLIGMEHKVEVSRTEQQSKEVRRAP